VNAVRLHDLRNTFAALQLTAGTHHMQVSDWRGQDTKSLVLEVYGEYIPDDEAAAYDVPAPPASVDTAVVQCNVVPLFG